PRAVIASRNKYPQLRPRRELPMRGGLLHLLLPLFFALSVLLGPYGAVNPFAHGLGSFVMELRILRTVPDPGA
ncbi:MAG: hypothetical protein ACP5G6_05225, partial [Conexivisphaera sp.]